MDDLYVNMITLRERVKLLHFQTRLLSIHQTTDQFIADFDLLSDAFWEVMQGSDFRIELEQSKSMQLDNTKTPSDLNNIFEIVIEGLMSIKEHMMSHPVVVSVDNLLERINKFKYLLTFE